jgi:hypothetical protein
MRKELFSMSGTLFLIREPTVTSQFSKARTFQFQFLETATKQGRRFSIAQFSGYSSKYLALLS